MGTQNVRLELDVPREDGRGWRRTHSFTETQEDDLLSAQWCKDIQKGASHLLEETWVKASEAHYDAKLFPHVHPYGTGSVYSEPGAGGIQHHARNRLTNIQSWFRRSSTWGFWFLTRLIQSELFFKNARRRELGRKTASPADDKDAVTRLFGTAMPADIPESTGWWQRQTKDLLAASDDAETVDGFQLKTPSGAHSALCPAHRPVVLLAFWSSLLVRRPDGAHASDGNFDSQRQLPRDARGHKKGAHVASHD